MSNHCPPAWPSLANAIRTLLTMVTSRLNDVIVLRTHLRHTELRRPILRVFQLACSYACLRSLPACQPARPPASLLPQRSFTQIRSFVRSFTERDFGHTVCGFAQGSSPQSRYSYTAVTVAKQMRRISSLLRLGSILQPLSSLSFQPARDRIGSNRMCRLQESRPVNQTISLLHLLNRDFCLVKDKKNTVLKLQSCGFVRFLLLPIYSNRLLVARASYRQFSPYPSFLIISSYSYCYSASSMSKP